MLLKTPSLMAITGLSSQRMTMHSLSTCDHVRTAKLPIPRENGCIYAWQMQQNSKAMQLALAGTFLSSTICPYSIKLFPFFVDIPLNYTISLLFHQIPVHRFLLCHYCPCMYNCASGNDNFGLLNFVSCFQKYKISLITKGHVWYLKSYPSLKHSPQSVYKLLRIPHTWPSTELAISLSRQRPAVDRPNWEWERKWRWQRGLWECSQWA